MLARPAVNRAPDVTVVIPAWGALVAFLPDALASIREQIGVARVIVVDNASAPPVVASGAEVVRLPQRVSAGAVRNAGLEVVRTPYVLFLDADDLLVRGAVERLRSPFDVRPELVVSAGRAEGWQPHTGRRAPWGFPPTSALYLHSWPQAFAAANLLRNRLPVVGAAILSTHAARAAAGFSATDRGEDWALGAVLAFLGPVRIEDACLLTIRVRPDSLTSRNEHLRGILATRRELRRRVRRSKHVPAWGKSVGAVAILAHWASLPQRLRHRHGDF